jgi:hypothetical protein
MTEHRLKTWPKHFNDILCGLKTFEVRRDDRGFQVGDTLILEEYDRTRKYSGRYLTRKVTHLLRGGEFGIEEGHVVMSITHPSAT